MSHSLKKAPTSTGCGCSPPLMTLSQRTSHNDGVLLLALHLPEGHLKDILVDIQQVQTQNMHILWRDHVMVMCGVSRWCVHMHDKSAATCLYHKCTHPPLNFERKGKVGVLGGRIYLEGRGGTRWEWLVGGATCLWQALQRGPGSHTSTAPFFTRIQYSKVKCGRRGEGHAGRHGDWLSHPCW